MRTFRWTYRAAVWAALAGAVAGASPARAQGIAALDDAISGLSMPMRVLVIAAHPDDEDTQLITWLARGRRVETAYLSLTRGDGGQNIIGNELGESLGLIRTEELLAARRIDGGRQFFTRAYDFGFSKTADETFRHWPKDEILSDVVTVIRSFKPHVIVSMFSGTPRDGHGHHQAAGILAREAYDIAGDGARLPANRTGEQAPWTPLKFYRGAWAAREQEGSLRINVGEFNRMLGRSYAELAAESRSQHKSQAFGSLEPKGARFTQVRREASRVNDAQPIANERSLFDGIDTTWSRFRVGATPVVTSLLERAETTIRAAQSASYLRDPSTAVGPLLEVERALSALMARGMFDNSRASHGAAEDLQAAVRVAHRRAIDALVIATGVAVEAEAPRELIAAGDSAPLTLTVYNRGRAAIRVLPPRFFDCTTIRLERIRYALDDRLEHRASTDSAASIPPDSARVWKGKACPGTALDELGPYWLTRPRNGDTFVRASTATPEDEATRGATMPVWLLASSGTTSWVVQLDVPIVYRYADPIRGDVSRPVDFVPEVAVTTDRAIEYAAARTPLVRQLRVELRSGATAARTVSVRLKLPPGLRADSVNRTISLPQFGAVRSATFTVRGELAPGRHTIEVVAESNGKQFTRGYTPIDYDHIRPQRLYRDATVAIEAVDLKIPADAVIAYIQGVGDNSAPMLQQLGLRVTMLDAADIPKTDLTRYNAIVVGTRAYESNEALVANNPALLEYVKRGGTMVVQYGQNEMPTPGIMPYPITLSRPADRVTDEASPIRFLDPKARVLTYPNAIDSTDFRGWIQDRSLYMPRTHAPEYASVISTNDPGEPANDGGILVAKYGSGTYVYTTLAFFRQLPNGVPGAARLFVNLLAAKAPDRSVVP
jgi:LmbE family N-acetylglucosaminyl deacetylase